jgi:hypothetical protein
MRITQQPRSRGLAVWAHDQSMTRRVQPDLFATDAQSDLFDDEVETPTYRADPDEVRAELYRILAEARAAQTLPWSPRGSHFIERFSHR